MKKDDNSYLIESDAISNINASNYDGLKLYYRQISDALLSADEEKELGFRVMQGDEKARNELIEKNLKLVSFVAEKFRGRGLDFEDLIEEGNIGLMKAVDRYNPEKENRFSTFAVYWIRQSIIKALRDKSRNIRIPYHLYDKIKEYKDVENLLMKKLGRFPTLNEIADELEIPVSDLAEVQNFQMDTVSINELVGDGDDELEDFIQSLSAVKEEPETLLIEKEDLKEALDSLFEKSFLKENEKYVLKRRYYDDVTLEKIGKELGVGRERIRQIEARALKKIRLSKYSNVLATYMDNAEEAQNNLKVKRMQYSEYRSDQYKK